MPPLKYVSPRDPEYHAHKGSILDYLSPKARTERRLNRLQESDSYSIIKGIYILMDDFMLDPILGLFIPGIGDAICATLAVPFLYTSLFKVRSISLTLCVLGNTMIDMCIGAIPFIGDIADFFIRYSKKNYQLIVEYAEGNPNTIREVDKKAFFMAILCGILGVVLYYLLKLVVMAGEWLYELFASIIAFF